MAEQAATGNFTDQPTASSQLSLQKVYVKDCSFEAPNSPGIFKSEWKPKITLTLNSAASKLDEDTHEVVLNVNVEAKMGETTAFLIELQQAGIFVLKDYPTEQLKALIGNYCPSMLYPFARQTIANLVTGGGFPQLLLQPMNFDALFLQAEAGQALQGQR
ncbi:MAG: protein-export chaperone SecB [Gammaproteobacteria bacterium]|nr:protein-export chaperone SecB [Gammaproteobacteria bacterium]